jgi:ABC-2 type transport system ATP-binding protein
MIAIKIDNVVKTFGPVRALDGLNLEVQTGSIFGFLGPNGAGKTTALRILAGLAQPTSGSVSISGITHSNTPPTPFTRTGYLPEEPAFYAWMSPREYLDFIGKIFKMDQKARKTRSDELLELTGLKDVSKRRIGGFSRGMRQRLGVAQALVNRPEVLLLDEPVSALDPGGRKEVLELIEKLGKECTVLMSSHILADVERICDTVGIINKGKLITQAKQNDLLNRYTIPALELVAGNSMIQQMPEWKTRLEGLPSVSGVTVEGYTFRIAVKDVHSAQQEIMRDVIDQNAHIERLEVVKPSLEDIFMQLVGLSEEKK